MSCPGSKATNGHSSPPGHPVRSWVDASRTSPTSRSRRSRCAAAATADSPLTWQSTKIGAGPTPIETDEGWLVLYHGVLTSCNGLVYSMGAALLDLEEP